MNIDDIVICKKSIYNFSKNRYKCQVFGAENLTSIKPF